ncbi:hypothetical protein ACTFIU_006214 [Dictyostelium citrinum]
MKIILFILILKLLEKKCLSENSFQVPYIVYDFKPSHPGFNINYTHCSENSIKNNGLVKKYLKHVNHKPEYCCGKSKFNYIKNQQIFDQSFFKTPGSTKTIINQFKFSPVHYENGIVNYQLIINPFFPINGKGWNEGKQGNNQFWCIEGHYKFKYIINKKTSSYFSFYIGGEYYVYIDGKLVLEFSGTKDPETSFSHKSLNLTIGKTYEFDFFSCQRFDQYKPYRYISFKSPFIFECNYIPNVNSDVCPPPPPPPRCNNITTCNDNNLCTIDSCPSDISKIPTNANISDYCIHTPIKCSNGIVDDKCTRSLGCDPIDGKCKTEPISCDDGKFCTIDKCDPKIGCLNDPIVCPLVVDNCTKSLGCDENNGKCKTESILCNDGNSCTIDKCDPKIGCLYDQIVCPLVVDNCTKSLGCDPIDGKCKTEPISCDDGNSCTINKCDPKIGCLYDSIVCPLVVDNCTKSLGCDPIDGKCKTESISCDDGKFCTIDKCDPKIGCLNDPIVCPLVVDNCTKSLGCDPIDGKCKTESISCDDGKFCTIDKCDPKIGCLNDQIVCPLVVDNCTKSLGCDENDGKCKTESISCDDGKFCTIDKCDPKIGCLNDPIVCPLVVDNCTKSLGCDPIDGKCKTEPISCNNGNSCTIDKCDPKIGCVNDPIVCPLVVDNCTKSLGCDKNDGKCKTESISCDDGNSCTTDTCDPKIGCIHTPVLCYDQDLCKSVGCDQSTGKCKLLSIRKCPPKKTIGLLGLGIICLYEKCEPTTGECIIDYSGGFFEHLLCYD